MKHRYSAREIAELRVHGYPTTRRGVEKMARNATPPWKHVWEKMQGGHRKMYLFNSLPDDLRIAIAGRNPPQSPLVRGEVGSYCPLPAIEAARAGAEAGLALARMDAEDAERTRIAKQKGLLAFNTLSEQRRAEAEARFELLLARDAFIRAAGLSVKRGSIVFAAEYNAGRIENLAAYIKDTQPEISWESLARYQRKYQEGGLAALANGWKNPRRGQTSLSEICQEVVTGMLWHRPTTHTTSIMRLLAARFGNSCPHEASVRRFRGRWETANKSYIEFRVNPDRWKQHRQFAVGRADAEVKRLNQLWEFDSTWTDVMLLDGRYTLVGVIDVYSRRARMLVCKTSRALSVAALFRRAIYDWGVPETAKTDNGADYVSAHMVRVFDGLGVEQALCTPFSPEEKPHIERFFKTFNHDLIEMMPDYIGHSVAERKDIEARRSFADRLMKKNAEPLPVRKTADEFQDFCDRWCRAIYEQNEHGGLNGQKPADMARNWIEPTRKIIDERALDLLLAPAPKDGGRRIIGNKGVRVENGNYMSEAMAGHEGEGVLVLLDETDLGAVYVFTVNEYDERQFLCKAIDPELTGISRTEYASRMKAVQKQVLAAGVKELKKLARKVGAETAYEEIMAHRESLIENVIEFPKPSVEHTTAAIEDAKRAVAEITTGRRDDNGQAEMEAMVEERVRERAAAPPTPLSPPLSGGKVAERKVIPIFGTMSERYQYIKNNIEQYSDDELAFFVEFYETKVGRFYKKLDGDLRER